jgi:predicted amidohydrolase
MLIERAYVEEPEVLGSVDDAFEAVGTELGREVNRVRPTVVIGSPSSWVMSAAVRWQHRGVRASAGEHGGPHVAARRQTRVTDGVDAVMNPVQPPPQHSMPDRACAQAHVAELLQRDRAALPVRNPSPRQDPRPH